MARELGEAGVIGWNVRRVNASSASLHKLKSSSSDVAVGPAEFRWPLEG